MRRLVLPLVLIAVFGSFLTAQNRRARHEGLGVTIDLPKGWEVLRAGQAEELQPLRDAFADDESTQAVAFAAHTKKGLVLVALAAGGGYPLPFDDLANSFVRQMEKTRGLKRALKPRRLKVGRRSALAFEIPDLGESPISLVMVDREPAQLLLILTGGDRERTAALRTLSKAVKFDRKFRARAPFLPSPPLRGRAFGVEAAAGHWTNLRAGVEVRDASPIFINRKVDKDSEADFRETQVNLTDIGQGLTATLRVEEDGRAFDTALRATLLQEQLKRIDADPGASPRFEVDFLGEKVPFVIHEPGGDFFTEAMGVALRGAHVCVLRVFADEVSDLTRKNVAAVAATVHALEGDEVTRAQGRAHRAPRLLGVDRDRIVGLGAELAFLDYGLTWTQPEGTDFDLMKRAEARAWSRDGSFVLAVERNLAAVYREEHETDATTPRAAYTDFVSTWREKYAVEEPAKVQDGGDEVWGGFATKREDGQPYFIAVRLTAKPGKKGRGRMLALVGQGSAGDPTGARSRLEAVVRGFRRAAGVAAVEKTATGTRFRRWGIVLAHGEKGLEEAPEDKAGLPQARFRVKSEAGTLSVFAARLDVLHPADTELFERRLITFARGRSARVSGKPKDVMHAGYPGRRFRLKVKGGREEGLIVRRGGVLYILTAGMGEKLDTLLPAFGFEGK